MRADIIVVGSINIDMVFCGERLPVPGETVTGAMLSLHPGGKGANQAVAAARMGAGTAMLGCVGADDHGRQMVSALTQAGVDCTRVDAASHPTGCAGIFVDSKGDNCICVANGANDLVTPELVAEAKTIISQAKVLLVQLEIPLAAAVTALEIAASAGVTTILDPAPAMELSPDILSLVDFITPNSREASMLTGIDVHCWQTAAAAAQELHQRGVDNVLVTMGKHGAYFHSATGQVRIAAPQVEVVDSTAAGDAFNGALAAALSQGVAPDIAADWAAAAGAMAASVAGAQPSLPSWEMVAQVVPKPW